jgi:redox-sensitive bicupin YhaK (pirin superfamily)
MSDATLALRRVDRVVDSQVAPVGSFTVRRALPARDRHSVGPWVFLDHFGPYKSKPGVDGVGAHPHAGIETVTYLLEGRNEHRDSAGHHGIVGAGGAQWMTAGRGVVHSEHPLDTVQHGIQLWTSLPRAQKLMEPRYQRIDASSIPKIERNGATVRVIAGSFDTVQGPAQTLMPLMLWHVTVPASARVELAIDEHFEAAAYVVEGEGRFGADDAVIARQGQLAILGEGGAALPVENASSRPLELLVLGGAPAEGPLVFHGPFVMNSVEQVRAAEVAYRTGRMGALE